MSTVFDSGGIVVPLAEVERAEKTSSGKLRVYLKSNSVIMIPAEEADAFVEAFKAFHEKET
jgi:hypothetical protein